MKHFAKAAAAVSLFMAGGCSEDDVKTKDLASAPTQTLSYSNAQPRALDVRHTVTGRLVPREEVAVSGPIGGDRVIKLLVDEGDVVRAGQVVAVLDSTLAKEETAVRSAQLREAQLVLSDAAADARRADGLAGTGLLSGEAYGDRKLAWALARSRFEQALRSTRVSKLRLSNLQLRAPAGGFVLRRHARLGEVYDPSQPVMIVARDGEMEAEAQTSARSLASISLGSLADVELESGRIVTGKVRLIGTELDPHTGLARVRVNIGRGHRLQLAGVVNVTFRRSVMAPVAVPDRSVRRRNNTATVALIDGENRVRTVDVRTGETGSGYTQILGGINRGDRVVTTGQGMALDGDKVTPVHESNRRG